MRYLVLFWLTLLGLSIWSFGLTDPNMVFVSWPLYWNFQNGIWFLARNYQLAYTGVFLALISSLFWLYSNILRWLQAKKEPKLKVLLLGYLLLLSPLLFSYNALSHDVFNYLFNAKIVLVYHANPHVQTALEFPQDDWTRFMHNTHTVAPYGYGWTALSLAPALLGLSKFTWSWLVFRLFSILSLVLCFFALRVFARKMGKKLEAADLAYFFLNPLVLIEVVTNSHNDLWMMVLALLSFTFLLDYRRWSFGMRVLVSGIALFFSISIKYATATLLPLWFALLFFEKFEQNIIVRWFRRPILSFVPYIAAVCLLVPLLTSQSQQYLPWYLTWSLIFLPFITSKTWRKFWLVLSFAALLRYLPWLYSGGYEANTVEIQKIFSLGIPALWLTWYAYSRKKPSVGEVLIGKTVHE